MSLNHHTNPLLKEEIWSRNLNKKINIGEARGVKLVHESLFFQSPF